MPDWISRWPSWYLGIASYLGVLGILGIRAVVASRASYAAALAQSKGPRERGRVHGHRAGALARAATWLVGAALLLGGWLWIQVAMALLLLYDVRQLATAFARGMAEGRKASELAAAPEYVAGRAPPGVLEWGLAGVVFGVLRVLPAIMLFFSWQLHSR